MRSAFLLLLRKRMLPRLVNTEKPEHNQNFEIPFSWYAIDVMYGNNCFWILDTSSNITVPISIPSGNYTQTNFISQLNSSFLSAGFTFPD